MIRDNKNSDLKNIFQMGLARRWPDEGAHEEIKESRSDGYRGIRRRYWRNVLRK